MNGSLLKKIDYPKNLLIAMQLSDEVIEGILEDREKMASLEYAIYCLKEREEVCIHSFYRDKLSYSEIGKMEVVGNISGSRTAQVTNNALRKLRTKKYKNIITYGVKAYISKRLEEQQEYINMLTDPITDYDQKKESIITSKLEDSIDILDLNVRSRNCLARVGIFKIWQLFLTDIQVLAGIRNCGPTSRIEIINKTKQICGFSIMEDTIHNELDIAELKKRAEMCYNLGYFDNITYQYMYKKSTPVVITRRYGDIEMLFEHTYYANNGAEYAVYSLNGLIFNDKFKYVAYIDQYTEYTWNTTCEIRMTISELPEDLVKDIRKDNDRLNLFNAAIVSRKTYNYPSHIRMNIIHFQESEMLNGNVKVTIVGMRRMS
jgi:hypothetical protein